MPQSIQGEYKSAEAHHLNSLTNTANTRTFFFRHDIDNTTNWSGPMHTGSVWASVMVYTSEKYWSNRFFVKTGKRVELLRSYEYRYTTPAHYKLLFCVYGLGHHITLVYTLPLGGFLTIRDWRIVHTKQLVWRLGLPRTLWSNLVASLLYLLNI